MFACSRQRLRCYKSPIKRQIKFENESSDASQCGCLAFIDWFMALLIFLWLHESGWHAKIIISAIFHDTTKLSQESEGRSHKMFLRKIFTPTFLAIKANQIGIMFLRLNWCFITSKKINVNYLRLTNRNSYKQRPK